MYVSPLLIHFLYYLKKIQEISYKIFDSISMYPIK